MAESDDDKKAEYTAIYNIFKKFLDNYGDMESREDLLEEMMALRADFAMNHAIKGFGMDFEEAMALIRNTNTGLTQLEQEKRSILLAALDNLVDFAVAEEFQMSVQLPEEYDENNPDDLEAFEKVFDRYNEIYAEVENGDIEHAMGIAAGWVLISRDTMLTYMTQGDNRVRPWHMALEGTSYPKREFPAWLIPPIEHGCRCFLVEEGDGVLNHKGYLADVVATKDEIPDFVNPVFRDSVCKGGRIFGAAHSYFQIPKKNRKHLREVAQKIKDKWLEK